LLRASSASFIIQNRKIKAYIKYIYIKIITSNKYTDSKLFLTLLLSNIKDLHTELHANIDNIAY